MLQAAAAAAAPSRRGSRARHHGASPVEQLHAGGRAQQLPLQRPHHKRALATGGRRAAPLEVANAGGRKQRVLCWDHSACRWAEEVTEGGRWISQMGWQGA